MVDSYFEDDDAAQRSSENGSDDLMGEDEEEENDNIAHTESRLVAFVRFAVVFLLIGVTIGSAVAVYFYVSGEEESAFNEEFDDSSNKLFDAMGSVLDQSMGAIDSLMISIVSFQKLSNSSWPYVTVPDYAVQAAKILTLSRAAVVGVYPRVLQAEREKWEDYSVTHDEWVNEGIQIQAKNDFFQGTNVEMNTWQPAPKIYDDNGVESTHPKYYPTWQIAPVAEYRKYNWDLYPQHPEELDEVEIHRVVTMGRTVNVPEPKQAEVNWISELIGPDQNPEEPMFPFYYPIVGGATDAVSVSAQNDANHPIVGVIGMTMFWSQLMRNILPPDSSLVVVFGNDCNQTMTYQINGDTAQFLGIGDLHDEKFNDTNRFTYFYDLGQYSTRGHQYSGFPLSTDYCPYWMTTYPTEAMEDKHISKDPLIFTLVALCIFFFTSAFFLAFDCVSEHRQKKVLKVAVQSAAVVSNLFPQVVRDRIFPKEKEKPTKPKERIETAKLRLQQFLRHNENTAAGGGSQGNMVSSANQGGDLTADKNAPIAELFPETTVMFCDIAGFTAWSSVREPAQVFTLLETLYGAYDRVATRRGVFKVETIGDSYVAVVGLPEPRDDHAVVMAKFARDVRERTAELVRKLGRSLGPDTADLEVRIGLNSGPVTAGVLRGERSRFQLFGDTVNTAARMESNGIPSKIQVSESTAVLLRKADKEHWVTKRDRMVQAKGLGLVQTYWVEPTSMDSSVHSDGEPLDETGFVVMDEKIMRLVDWNVEIGEKLLKQVVARRAARVTALAHRPNKRRFTADVPSSVVVTSNSLLREGTVLDEVKEVIMLPEYDPSLKQSAQDLAKIELGTPTQVQLRDYISVVASMYHNNNPFHSFEHASHVAMSVVKLLSRIVAPNDSMVKNAEEMDGPLESTLHDHTYGITSDPLTQFACVFSALIHDVDHPGVPNAQLIKENSPLDKLYKGKSLAEQNSVDLSWHLFMEDQYEDLRNTICATKSELARFRQLVVNAVMATDIMDKDLKKLRNERWETAFSERSPVDESAMVNTNRKATIVIEHLIQASDVAHTMQHWHIFRKWNERLFEEMYIAYKQGRAEKNPAEFWYKGEMGFFDFYIIPLAKKLSDCGVFGVSSDEYLSYAMKNREEWENRGQEVVEAMIAKFEIPNRTVAPTHQQQSKQTPAGDALKEAQRVDDDDDDDDDHDF